MIYIYDANGNLIRLVKQDVYQGSNRANTIYFIAPISSNNVVSVAFNLPNGVIVPKMPMTALNELPEVVNLDNNAYSVWEYTLPYTITKYTGAVRVQFFVYNEYQTIASQMAIMYVGQGVPILEEEENATEYEAVQRQVAGLNNDVDNLNANVLVLTNKVNGFPVQNVNAGNGTVDMDDYVDNGLYNFTGMSMLVNAPSFLNGASRFVLEVESQVGDTRNIQWISWLNYIAFRQKRRISPSEFAWTDWVEINTLNHEEKPTLTIDTTSPSITLTPQANNVYQYGELATLTLNFATASLNDCFNISFKSGETPTELIFNLTADGTTLAVVKDFVPEANTYCEIAGRWNGYVWNIVCYQVAQ